MGKYPPPVSQPRLNLPAFRSRSVIGTEGLSLWANVIESLPESLHLNRLMYSIHLSRHPLSSTAHIAFCNVVSNDFSLCGRLASLILHGQ